MTDSGGSHPQWTVADAARDELALPVVSAVHGSPDPKGGALVVPRYVKSAVRGEPVNVRPASVIRTRLRGSFDERLVILEDMADGECMAKAQVELSDVVPWVACPNCGEVGLTPKDEASGKREVEVVRSVSPKERLQALDILAKYGLGQLKEVSVENVRERVGKTVALARQMLGPDLAEQFIQAMRPIWKDQ